MNVYRLSSGTVLTSAAAIFSCVKTGVCLDIVIYSGTRSSLRIALADVV